MAEGKVLVNGTPALEPGLKIRPGTDVVEVEGQRIGPPQSLGTTLILFKPKGVLSTARDDRGRKTVLDLLPAMKARVYPVGRLDLDSEGLILLTDDGELAFRLTHPRYNVLKRYRVRVRGKLTQDEARRFRTSLPLAEGMTREAGLRFLDFDGREAEYEVSLKEGRKRQVRRMMDLLGHEVTHLCRIGEAGLSLGHLKPGQWRALTPHEVQRLRQEVGLA